jgi:hypothetical protein
VSSSTPPPPTPPEHPLRPDRAGLVILLLATLVGLWLGLAGPDISPVTPAGAPGQVATSLVAALVGGVGS